MKDHSKLIFVLLFLFTLFVFAQNKQIPLPEGGIKSLMENVIYPESAKKEGKEGKVILEVTIDEEGKVVNAIVKESGGAEFNDSAIAAVNKTIFLPAEMDGKKVKASVVIPFQFKLDGEKKKE